MPCISNSPAQIRNEFIDLVDRPADFHARLVDSVFEHQRLRIELDFIALKPCNQLIPVRISWTSVPACGKQHGQNPFTVHGQDTKPMLVVDWIHSSRSLIVIIWIEKTNPGINIGT